MTVRWPWQRRLDAKRKREEENAARRLQRKERDAYLDDLDPTTLCECGHPLNAHPRLLVYGTIWPRRCKATVTRRRQSGDDAWPCGCREFKEAAVAA